MLAVLVGGLTQVSRQSQGYDVNSDRALAAQGTVAADQSNATSVTVRKIVNDLPTQTRQGLQATLDGAVQQTSVESVRAQVAAGSTPLGTVATQFAAVFADRAQAMTQLRAAVYGYLGMQPIAPAERAARTTPCRHRHHAAPLGHPGHESHCRGRRALDTFGRPLPLGPALARRRGRTRDASPSVWVHQPPGVAARECGRPGRSAWPPRPRWPRRTTSSCAPCA